MEVTENGMTRAEKRRLEITSGLHVSDESNEDGQRWADKWRAEHPGPKRFTEAEIKAFVSNRAKENGMTRAAYRKTITELAQERNLPLAEYIPLALEQRERESANRVDTSAVNHDTWKDRWPNADKRMLQAYHSMLRTRKNSTSEDEISVSEFETLADDEEAKGKAIMAVVDENLDALFSIIYPTSETTEESSKRDGVRLFLTGAVHPFYEGTDKVKLTAAEVRRLAEGLVSGESKAMGLLAAEQAYRESRDHVFNVTAKEVWRIGGIPDHVKFPAIDPETKEAFNSNLNKWYEEAQETPEYKIAMGEMTIEAQRYSNAFVAWYRPEEATERREAPPLISPLKLTSIVHVSNNPFDHDVNQALMRTDLWKTNTQAGHKYFDGAKNQTLVSYQNEAAADAMRDGLQEQALRALDRGFSKIKSDYTQDVIEICFHHWDTCQIKVGERAPILLSQICEYREVLPTGDNLINTWQALCDARSIRLSGYGIRNAALMEMDALNPQLSLFGEDQPPEAGTLIHMAPGFYLRYAVSNNAFKAPFASKVWALNPKTRGMAKRLARALSAEWRMNAIGYTGGTRWRSVKSLLDGAGIEISDADRRNPQRFRDRMEVNIQELITCGVINTQGLIYQNPNWENGTGKGWLGAWLSQMARMEPVGELMDLTKASALAVRGSNAQKAKRALPSGKKRGQN